MPSKNTPAKANPNPVHPKRCNPANLGAVVETVTVVLPLPVSEAGLKPQLAPNGRPEHDVGAKFMVLLYPVWPATVKARFPLPPGLGMVMLGPPAAKVKSACTLTVMGEAEDAT
jgi:hypothetical protein